ncbi:hypothetical protein AXG93_131s1370 [Marchantia polymorpha subsp. ruderalis]|uniref:Uncharacterized protein n=1 Tax=Marchantia polymorpha subsp. ruderalis TaxID=1480154 RepID=A0A176W057_MARPO|nr:hypothetical protein AXG93_131s1370 [Marchantia polymorpha subsp. ruderalis]
MPRRDADGAAGSVEAHGGLRYNRWKAQQHAMREEGGGPQRRCSVEVRCRCTIRHHCMQAFLAFAAA